MNIRYKISPGLLLLLIELIKQGPPEWAVELLSAYEKSNKYSNASDQKDSILGNEDNIINEQELRTWKEIVGPYRPNRFEGFASLLTHLKKNQPEWSRKPAISLNSIIKVTTVHDFQGYVSGEAFKYVDFMDPATRPIKIEFKGNYQRTFEQMATVNTKGYLSLRKCSLYPDHYQVVVETGPFVIDDLFIDLYNHVCGLKTLLDSELGIPRYRYLILYRSRPISDNFTDELLGDCKDAQCFSKELLKHTNGQGDPLADLFKVATTNFSTTISNESQTTSINIRDSIYCIEVPLSSIESKRDKDEAQPENSATPSQTDNSKQEPNHTDEIEKVQPKKKQRGRKVGTKDTKPRKTRQKSESQPENANISQKSKSQNEEAKVDHHDDKKSQDFETQLPQKPENSKQEPDLMPNDIFVQYKVFYIDTMELKEEGGMPSSFDLEPVDNQYKVFYIDKSLQALTAECEPVSLPRYNIDTSIQYRYLDTISQNKNPSLDSFTLADVVTALEPIQQISQILTPQSLTSKLPYSPNYRVYQGYALPDKWLKHKKYPYSKLAKLLRPFIIYYYQSVILNNFNTYENFNASVRNLTNNPLALQILDVMNFNAQKMFDKINFKLFVYEFKVAQFINHSFNSDLKNSIKINNLRKLFASNLDYLDQQSKEFPAISSYPYVNVEIHLDTSLQYKGMSWFEQRVINKFSSPWGSESRSFTIDVQMFFKKRQDCWVDYFKQSPLVQGLNQICQPIFQIYYDFLQGTFACGPLKSGEKGYEVEPYITTEECDFPWLGSRRNFLNMFTVNMERNLTNPGRFNQKESVFLTMRKELREVFLSLMFTQGFGQAFHDNYSFGNIDIKAAHTYAVVALMRNQMPTLSGILQRTSDLWVEAETMSPAWENLKVAIGRPELKLKPFLKVLFYGALNGGNVSNAEHVAPKIQSLLNKHQLDQDNIRYSISQILSEHPIINEVSGFVKFCNNLDGCVKTPLQPELVDKRSKNKNQQSFNDIKNITGANYKLASTLLQCVEYLTIVAAQDAFVRLSIDNKLDMHIILNLHDGFLFVYNKSLNIQEIHKQICESCQYFYNDLYIKIPPTLELTLGEQFISKYIEKMNEKETMETIWYNASTK